MNQPGAVLLTDAPQRAGTITRSPVSRPSTIPTAAGSRIYIGLDESQPDAYSIISILQGLSEQFARHPTVREFTVNEVLCSSRNNDIEGHVIKITAFVKDNLIYTRDPAGSEYVISPLNMITQLTAWANGVAGASQPTGDCDDHVLLLNSMLGSVGVPTRVVGVKLGGSALFNHVISSALIGNQWCDIDPCAKEVPQPVYLDKLITA